jgi:peptide subunit release factor 1 (eRF1)
VCTDGGIEVATSKTLDQALKDILKDDHKVTKWDATALKELIMADGRVSTEEKLFLENALMDNIFDEQAYKILHELLLREDLKFRT